MSWTEVRRLGVPLAIAVAIVLSMKREPAEPPVELPSGVPAAPSVAELDAALQRALAPGAPGYERGAADAPVTVLEFADFGCRYCARFAAETYPGLAGEYVRTGRVRWRYVPFVMGMFANGAEAARAAVCAAEQGRSAFDRMHERLYRLQGEWTGSGDAVGVFRAYAAAVGLDEARFSSCWSSDLPVERIRAANELADQLGVRATPTFFVAGNMVEGALPLAQFRAVLDAELGRRDDNRFGGTR